MSDTAQSLGKYQLIREIARSNDIVYEAYDPLMNRRVALKELAMPGGLNDNQKEDRRNRFLREARAAGTLTHPNIVTVYEYGEDSGRHYIAMEFLDGHTLRNELDTHGFLPLDRCFDIAKSVLDALDYAHKNGVIHRDIKPENIQLMGDGRIKITDFGIARLTFEPNLTMDGQVFGTPSYMSPEQVVGREIDARSDLFSLGEVLYEMVSGRKPFIGDSVVSITYAIMNSEPPQPQQANFAVWQVLQRAMDKSPALRYPGAREMKQAIEEAEATSFSNSPVLDPMAAASPYTGMYAASAQNNPYANPQFQINAPPIGNPYVNMPYQMPAQSPSYTFNPYAAPPPGMPQTGSSPGYPPIPVYYPPPPRPPLVTPEMKSVMGKVFIAFLVLGTIITLGVVAASSMSKAVERYKVEQPPASKTSGGAKTTPQATSSSSSPSRAPTTDSTATESESDKAPDIRQNASPSAPKPDLDEAYRLYLQALDYEQKGMWPEARQALYAARTRIDKEKNPEEYQRVDDEIARIAR